VSHLVRRACLRLTRIQDKIDFELVGISTSLAFATRLRPGQKDLTAELGPQEEERSWLFPLEHRTTSEVRGR
jgi:hypothetical protein